MSAFDDNFAYALVSSDNRTLKITGVNPAKYNALNTNWGAIPAIPALYAGPTLAYNGYGTPENAFSVIEIADSAFNGRTEFAQGTLSLPSTLQRIGNNAFNGVKIIGRLTIPSSVIYIGTQAFSNTMIDELVVENETNTDILAGVVDATRVANKETAARVASDAILTSVKVPKANPELTGVTTIPNAVISAAVITNATIKTANIATETANSAVIDYYEANVSDAVKNSRFTVSSVDGNLLSVNGVNENAAAIEIVLSSGVYRDGTALVSEIYSKLNSKGIAWVGGSTIAWGGTSFDPNTNTLKLGYSTDAPASVVSPALVIRTKFSKNGVAYDSSRLLGASGATVVSYEDGAFVLAYGNRNGLSFPLSVNLNTPTISVSGTATFDGSVSVSGQWNYLTQKPKYNAQVLATESYVDSRMKTIKGESLTSTVNTLAAIASAINEDPAFAVHVVQSQSAILNSITSIASVRSTAVSSLSTALSITASTLQSIDISISGGISSIIPVRSSQMESVSTSLNTTVSALQSVDLSISSALSGRISDRGSAMNSLSAAVSTSASLLQNVDNSIATGITNESTTRSHSISSISTSLVNAVSSLQTVDATLSNAITTASTVRSTAVSYLSSILSGTVPALQAVDTAFSGALTQQTANRVASVASLSSAVSAQISTTQSMNAVILPKISSGGLSQDDTTSTVFNMLGINVGESLTFVKTGGTFAINDKITIVYSDTDYLKGTVTGVAGSNVTFTVASKATSAVETQIYSTTGSFGDSGLLSLGSSNYIAPISPSPSFTNSSNYVVTTMSASRLRAYTNGGAQFYMNLLDGSNTILGTSPLSLYYTVPFDYLLTFKTAFVPRNSTLKQQFVFNNGINVRLSYDVSGAAYTTMKGYAVPYSSGSVQIDRNGALQNTRISAIDGLSNTILNTVGSLQAKLTTNQTDFNLNSTARIASLNSIVSTTTQSLVSVQSVVSTLASTLASATTVRSTNVSSLSTMISTNVSSFSSAIAAHSTTLSTQISNRSTQVLNAINTLVGGAPSSLDTLFEIATALDSGPQLYSMVSNTEMALTAETTARANEVGSVAGSLATAVATLQSVDTVLSTGISTAISARLSGVSSAANVLSTTVSTLQSVDAVLSTGISTATSARLSGVASVSGSLATAVSTLQSGNTVLSTGISTATSARASGVASVSDALLATVTTLQSVDTVLSAGISTATSARLSGVASVSGSLSATVSSHQSVMTLLSASFATLNAGINLTLLANTTAVDSAINGIVGTNAISAMDTLNEIAVAMNNNASIGTALETMVAAKGATSIVSSLSDNAATKLAQASYTSLSATVSDKANTTLATQLQSSVSSLTIVYSIISSEAHSLQSNMTVNTQITTQLADTIRQLDALYVYHGLVNANGTIKYKANTLSDPTIQTSSLVFTIDGNHQVTKITQVAAVQFDSTQVIVKYTSRGIEYTLNPIALTNRMYTFNIDSSGTTDYTANATAIVVSGIETALRLAPVNSLTIPKLALSSYTYAAPTVQTPYAATTWNDTTGKISQVLRVNFESGVQKLQVDGTTYDVAGTTEKVVTLEYYPGASGTWTAKALNSASKLESPSLTLSNVYNDYPQYAAPVLVEGTKAISLSGSTCTYSATFSSDANVVEVHAYNSGTSTYSKVQDLTPASANQFSVSITYDVSRIGQPLFKLKAATSASKRASDFSTVGNCEPFTFPPAVISGNLSYTNLNTDPKSFSVSATYTVHSMATVVQVINSGTGGTLMSPNPIVSNGSVSITFNFTEAQAIAGLSFYVRTNTNSVGLQSSSDAQVLKSQYDAPVIVAGTKVITQPSATELSYTAQFTSASSDGLIVYDADGVAHIGSSTGSSSPFSLSLSYNISKVGSVVFKVASKATATIRQSALVNIVAEDFPTHPAPLLSGGITYGDSGGINTAQMNYIVSSDVTTVDVAKPDGSEWVDGAIFFVNYDFQTQLAQLNKPENINKIFRTSITGSSTGSVRGTNTYRVSSPLSTAAVHAGVLSVGETKMVHLKIVAPINPYVGSTRNGIFSSTYNDSYYYLNGTMAFEFMTPYISQTIMSTNAPSRVISLTLSYANSIEPINTAVFAMANDYGKKSAASTVMPLLSKHEPPILTGEIIYGMSGANYTAQMKYTVNYHVTAVNVLNSDGSALPNGGSFTQSILSTTGTSRVISVTVVYATSMTVKVISQANAYGNLGYESATQLLQITYETPVAVSALRETSRGPREVFTTLYNNNVITLEDGNGVVSEYTTLLNPNVSMSDSANYPITFSMTFKTKIYFAYSNSSIAGKFSFSSIFIYWSLTTDNPGNVYFQINNGERVHICTIESNTYYTASITRTNDTTIIVKFVVTSTNAVIGSQTLVYSSTILNDNLRMDNINMAATGPNYHVQSGNSQATYNSGIVFGRGHISNVNISKSQMITMNIINEYYLAKSSKFRVFDNAGVQIGVDITTTVTKNGTQYFVAPANYTDDNIGQPVMKVKYISSGSPDLRDSEFSNAIIGVLLAQHAAPTITAGTKQITSFSIVNPDNRYQATNFPALGALSSWDMSIYFKATGGAGTWRGLVGAIYNGSGRNWGVWINNDNNVYWGWVVDNAYTMLPVALNVNYCLKITQTSTTIKFDLTNLDNSTTASETYNHANPVMGTSGPVTIGGWIYNGSETLIGSISAVNVGLYSLTASFDSPAAYSIYNVANQVITPTDVVLPNKFILRTGTSNWRQYVPLTIANESADPQGWDPDGQFNTSYSGNFIATQFSYFATYWLIRLKIPVGEYLSLDAYANGALIGYFIFGKRITDGELVGRLSKYNSGQLYTLVLQPDAVNAANTANATDAGMITRTANGLPDQMVLRLGNTDWKQYVPLTTASLLNVQSWTPDEQFYTNGGPPNYNTQQFSYFAHYWLNRLRVPVGKSMSVPAMAVQGAIGIFSFWKNDASTIKGNLSTYNGGATYDMPVQTDAATAGVAAQPKYLVSSAYYTAMVGQPIFKLRVPGTVSMLESEYLIVNGEETPTHAVPVISGTITYGTSGANSTAQMNYTVSSSVDTVSVLPTDSSAVNFTQSIVSTTGASRIISITITYTSNLSFKVIATPNAYGNQSGVSALQTLQPVIVPYSLDSLIVHKNSGAAIMPSPTGTGIVRTYHSTWANDVNLTDTTSPNTSGNNHHGVVIEMSLNGEWVVVGSPHHDNNVISSSNYGRSVVYRRNNINTENWVVAFGYTATYANAAHGSAVSIAGDGSVYAASEPNYYSNQGIIRLFVAASGPGYNDFYNIRNINQYIGLKYDPFGGYLNPGQTAESGYGLSFSGTGRYLAITSNRPGHYTAGNTCGVISTYNIYETETLWCFDPDPNVLTNNYRNVYPHSADDIVGAESSTRLGAYMKLSTDGTKLIATTETPLSVRVYTRTFFESTPGNFSKNERNNWSLVFSKEEPNMLSTTSVTMSQDGNRFAITTKYISASVPSMLKVYNMTDSTNAIRTFDFTGFNSAFKMGYTVSFSADGNVISTAEDARTDSIAKLFVWDVNTGNPIGNVIEAPKTNGGWNCRLSMSVDGTRFVMSDPMTGGDGIVRIYRIPRLAYAYISYITLGSGHATPQNATAFIRWNPSNYHTQDHAMQATANGMSTSSTTAIGTLSIKT